MYSWMCEIHPSLPEKILLGEYLPGKTNRKYVDLLVFTLFEPTKDDLLSLGKSNSNVLNW